MSPEALFLFLSRCFESAAHHLDLQFKDPVAVTEEQLFGFAISMIVLRVFAVELGLKALIWRVVGEEPEYTHRLMRLFERLPEDSRARLDQRFQSIRMANPNYGGETDSLADVLTAHHNAFVEWRYPDFRGGHLNSKPNALNSVLEAIWEEFGSRE